MNIRKAICIFSNIKSDEYTEVEKGIAIYEVMKMPTHNGIKKSGMMEVINWLWNKLYELESDSK